MKSVAKPLPDSHVEIDSFRSNSSNKPRRNLYPPQHSSLPDPQTFALCGVLRQVWWLSDSLCSFPLRQIVCSLLRQPGLLQALIPHLQASQGGHLCFWNDALPQAPEENSIFNSKYIRRQNSSTIRMMVVIILLLLSKLQPLLSSLSFYLQ